jgi:2,3-bisphosphoglycerate-dependent phosphoglycerate mutase
MAPSDKIGDVILYIARHAEVDEDREGTIRGTLNIQLNEKGERQANELADLFERITLSAIYTDDLDRTYHTALPIAEAQGIEIQRDPELRSWDVGPELEGKSIDANEKAIKEFKMQPDKIPVGGQSWSKYRKQIIAAFNRYVSKALKASDPILLVLHGSGIQLIYDELGAFEVDGQYDYTPLEPSGLAAIYMARSGMKIKAIRGAKENKEE